MISICIPVLRRYDTLRDLLISLHDSDPMPDKIAVIDNGRNADMLRVAIMAAPDRRRTTLDVLTPNVPMGVAESWNWFLKNIPEERIISNDDITFAPDSIARLLASPADLVWAKGCGFACYVIRDACVRKIGYFDEEISPGYGYYEDEDYLQRLDGRGTREPSAIAEAVECGVRHVHSATLKAATHAQIMEHHRRFKIAQGNYIKKHKLEETFK